MNRLGPSLSACLLLSALAGCNPHAELRIGKPLQPTIDKHNASAGRVQKIATPCVLRMKMPERLPGQEDSILTHADLSTIYYYAVGPVFERAFQDAIYKVFDPADSGVLNAFTVEVQLSRAKLLIGSDTARYEVKAQAILRSDTGKIISTHDLEATKTSGFDGRTTPPAVWDAAYEMAFDCLEGISRDSRTYAAAEQSGGVLRIGRLAVVSCDIKFYDLRGNIKAAAGKTKRNPDNLRAVAEALAKALVDDLAPGDAKPRVAVLALHENNTQAKQRGLGKSFADYLQTAVENDDRVRLVERAELDRILGEHDLRSADLVENPGVLKQRELKISGIDYILSGGVSADQ
jgi:Curli production assembly/transport component CsgG